MFAPWKKSSDKPKQCIKKQRHHFANRGPYSQSYVFSSSHVWMWELYHKEDWVLKNWCFWIVVLEKILESPFDCKKIKPVNTKGNQPWIFIGRNDVEATNLGHLMQRADSLEKTPMLGKIEGKRWEEDSRDEMVGWHHWLNGHESAQTSRIVAGEMSLDCCSPWKSQTWLSNWTNVKEFWRVTWLKMKPSYHILN